jgi:hypothetical protein
MEKLALLRTFLRNRLLLLKPCFMYLSETLKNISLIRRMLMTNTDKNIFDVKEAALEKARNELSYATHLEDCGKNAGIRKMNANKADWLKWVVYLAELGLEYEKLLNEPVVAVKEEPKTDFQQVMELFQIVNKINF